MSTFRCKSGGVGLRAEIERLRHHSGRELDVHSRELGEC